MKELIFLFAFRMPFMFFTVHINFVLKRLTHLMFLVPKDNDFIITVFWVWLSCSYLVVSCFVLGGVHV